MRSHWLALAGILLATPLFAQQPQQPPSPAVDPARNRLDLLLMHWEQKMKSVETLVAHVNRIEEDKVRGSKDIFVGTAKFMRPTFAALDVQKKTNPQVVEKYICTGTYLYECRPQNKVIRIHELPPPKQGQVADDNFLSFLFGMKAEEAKRRYDLKLVKEDQYWIYVEILPRFLADKAEFQKARLVLSAANFLPRELWFEQPNGNELKWDIPKIEAGIPLNRTEFAPPPTPPGWNVIRVPRPADAPPPRIIRPNQ